MVDAMGRAKGWIPVNVGGSSSQREAAGRHTVEMFGGRRTGDRTHALSPQLPLDLVVLRGDGGTSLI